MSDHANTTEADKLSFHMVFLWPKDLLKRDTTSEEKTFANTSSREFLQHIKECCIKYRKDTPQYDWPTLTMVGNIHLGNERDVYFDCRLLSGKLRFKNVGDMFHDMAPTDEIRVVVEIKHGSDDKDYIEDPRTEENELAECKHHRIAVEKPEPRTKATQHSLMFRALTVVCPRSDPDALQFATTETYQREINGRLIGSCDDGPLCTVEMLPDENHKPSWLKRASFKDRYQLPYQKKDGGELRRVIREHIKEFNSMPGEEKDIPVLPSMTFQPFVPKPGIDALEIKDIHIAVRLVNKIQHLVGAADQLKLPMDVTAAIKAERDSEKDVRRFLLDGLEDRPGTEVGPLVREDVCGRWSLELWVMPQTPPGKKLEKLYRWEDGKENLKVFLDPQMVREGNRKLYVEGHLVSRDWRRDGDGRVVKM